MNRSLFTLLVFTLLAGALFAQKTTIIRSDENEIVVEIDFTGVYSLRDTTLNSVDLKYINGGEVTLRQPGEPWLPSFTLNAGIPFRGAPTVTAAKTDEKKYSNVLMLPFPQNTEFPEKDKLDFDKGIYSANVFFPANPVKLNEPFTFRYAQIAGIEISPFRYNPYTRELVLSEKIRLTLKYNIGAGNGQQNGNNMQYPSERGSEEQSPGGALNKSERGSEEQSLSGTLSLSKRGGEGWSLSGVEGRPVKDRMTSSFLQQNVINPLQAEKWMAKKSSHKTSALQNFWYDPALDYLKIEVSEKDLYRVTWDDLSQFGLTGTEHEVSSLQMFCGGEEVPLDITDINGDGYFNEGDYIRFIGFPPPASPYAKQNIYTNRNIYWLTPQGSDGIRYSEKDSYPSSWDRTMKQHLATVHYEEDLIYERFGHAPNERRDYWQWDKASAVSAVIKSSFTGRFPAFDRRSDIDTRATLRLNMHGMTTYSCTDDHKANIHINDRYLGTHEWDGQTETVYEKDFIISADSIVLYTSGNKLNVIVNGNSCAPNNTDEIRINWFEFDYWKFNRVTGNNFIFTSPPDNFGINRYQLWYWEGSDMQIFVPSRGEKLIDPHFTGDAYSTVFFQDSIGVETEYFTVSRDYYREPDSIYTDVKSSLHYETEGADYIILAHRNFSASAKDLAAFRSQNLSGFDNPRVKIVYIDEVYDEFSGGLLDPYAVKDFMQYAYENWPAPAPSYLVLLGDMSWDYRKIFESSRPNFIPSIPYHAQQFGQSVSDNLFVCVDGRDVVPDLAIGRLSCETPAEARELVNKIKNYPGDNGKTWKQNVLLIGAGQDQQDENRFGFNDQNMYLNDLFVEPNGYTGTKIFRYPSKEEYKQYMGDSRDIREAFDEGAVMTNFYGHGGGYQWDLVFLDDDIYELRNDWRMPFISSVTCYTAHFDNQNVFGEIFNKIPGKGSIGFWGNTGLTIWIYGVRLNNDLFRSVLDNENYVIGDALLDAKIKFASSGINNIVSDKLALFTLLGDPAVKLALPDKPDFNLKASDISLSSENILVGDSVRIKTYVDNLGRVFEGDSVDLTFNVVYGDTSYTIHSARLGSFGHRDSVSFDWFPPEAGLVELTAVLNEDHKLEEEDYSDNSAVISFSVYDLEQPNIIKPYDGISLDGKEVEFILGDIGYYVGLNLKYYIQVNNNVDFSSPFIDSGELEPEEGVLRWTISSLNKGEYYWRARLYDGEKFSNWTETRSFTIGEENVSGYTVTGKHLANLDNFNFLYNDTTESLVMNTEVLPPKPSPATLADSIDIPDSSGFIPSAITTDGIYVFYANKSFYNGNNPSPIYKIGTGYNSVKGKVYGTVPGFREQIRNSILYYKNYLYVSNGDAYSLLKVDPVTGARDTVFIEEGLLNSGNGKVQDGTFYLVSDGRYVYNIALRDSLDNENFIIRKIDPENGWLRTGEDLWTTTKSWGGGTSGFFAAEGYLYPYENFFSGTMKRIDLSDGSFEEEWQTNAWFRGYHSWCYDPEHDLVYAAVARNGLDSYISSFIGKYKEARGSITTKTVGPAKKWNSLSYDLDLEGFAGKHDIILEGKTSVNKSWDTLAVSIPAPYDLSGIDASEYKFLRMRFLFSDSTAGETEPAEFSGFSLRYDSYPEIVLGNNSVYFSPDSVMQGFDINMEMEIDNIGYSTAQNTTVKFYMNEADTAFYTGTVNIPADSSALVSHTISTDKLLFANRIKAVASVEKEFYSFNNIASGQFTVNRDSVQPVFDITFDGREIIDGDLIKSSPDIEMFLEDNSPLPLDTTSFIIYLDDRKVSFREDTLRFSYTGYPDSRAVVNWKPHLQDGTHLLEVMTRDASNNYTDSVAYKINFTVESENKIMDIYNYPNPFTDDTYFTFTLTGNETPDEMNIRIYTIAGRLIREIEVPQSDLAIKYLCKVYWDGRDQDGDEIANGVYLYKINTKYKDKTYTEIKKIAKVK